jgi:uncharacterized membrane protein
MKLKIINIGALFLLMLITGVFWGTWFTLTRSIESFSSEEFIHIGKVIISNVAIPMRIILSLGILLLILSLLLARNKKSISFYLGTVSFLLLIAVLVLTLAVLVPIDNNIKDWTPVTVPDDWEGIRNKWKVFHALRTLASLISFAFFSIFLSGEEFN